MPFYEYECSACSHQLEVLQKLSDTPLKKCPDCGKQTLKRLISAPVFRLKGSGWYETDFKSDKENKRNLAGSEEAAAESKPEPVKADTAGEAKKAEPKPEPAAKSESKRRVAAKPTPKVATKPTKAKAKAPARKPAAKKKARR